ncbi:MULTISPECIES: hypothetical protein [Pseudomonas]|uniref:Uncharacterized protein n=2 Tax=Pseudomonas fragariae (ex Marin et al. 2024) TaxID=3080056 RepID=A0ABU5B357_9PSED|nr:MULTISPECIES: hypothetical protein [Pseudomonas]MCW6055847.1 hypothetical protein [Pseudomonas fragi]MCA5969027.1 hypothetical protein [Pseudomonas sp. P129]MCH5513954.1 hypothetical protein [Pseudomonas syringae pv. syringae]MCH5552883.1 hypothetical protein [Pseudomonas syringae pv. syringae]MCH5576757.1 hypothetical protein [Pseudomonas syringae pv. syringae]
MADSASGMSKALATTTSFIEKAIEMRHFMLLISFILALDSCLVFFFQKNLLGAFAKLDAPEVSGGNALVFLGLFAFMMTLLFPTLRQLMLLPINYVSSKLQIRYEKFGDPEMRFASVVRRQAIIDRDKVALDILEKRKSVKEDSETNMNIGFAMSMLLALNFLVLGDANTHTLTQIAQNLLESATVPSSKLFIKISFFLFWSFTAYILLEALKPKPVFDRVYWPESDEQRAARLKAKAEKYGE